MDHSKTHRVIRILARNPRGISVHGIVQQLDLEDGDIVDQQHVAVLMCNARQRGYVSDEGREPCDSCGYSRKRFRLTDKGRMHYAGVISV